MYVYTPADRDRLLRVPACLPDAFREYAAGRALLAREDVSGNAGKAEDAFLRAAAKDPRCAPSETLSGAAATGGHWNIWEAKCTLSTVSNDQTEGTVSLKVQTTPNNTAVNAGIWWGFGYEVSTANILNLSAFSGGHLVFDIKTTYQGDLKTGFQTKVSGAATDCFLVMNSSYGYVNDGSWHTVSIPISAFTTASPAADLTHVNTAFLLFDSASPDTADIYLDNIHWTKN